MDSLKILIFLSLIISCSSIHEKKIENIEFLDIPEDTIQFCKEQSQIQSYSYYFICVFKDLHPRLFYELDNMSLWTKGPHKKISEMNLTNPYEFGYYNPSFLRKLYIDMNDYIRMKTELFGFNEKVYLNYFMKYCRVFYSVYRKLHSDTTYFSRQVERYKLLYESNRIDPYYLEKYYFFMQSDYAEGGFDNQADLSAMDYDANYHPELVKIATGFWIRRNIDQTDNYFFLILNNLVELYDHDFWAKEQNPRLKIPELPQ
jgi:hypothetical protein